MLTKPDEAGDAQRLRQELTAGERRPARGDEVRGWLFEALHGVFLTQRFLGRAVRLENRYFIY